MDWRTELARRPIWMNGLMLFCVYMAVVYVPWDLFVKPVAVDEEVWLGVRFHGTWAKILAVPHWAVYAAGAIGFWRMSGWMWPWASLYVWQMVIAMLVWPILYVGGVRGIAMGAVSALLFSTLATALWSARPRFQRSAPATD
jgi:hypothetical protein